MTPKQVRHVEAGILIIFVGQLLLLAAVVVIALGLRDNAAQGDRAHAALCVLRSDLHARVTASEEFLATHPHGIPGINAKQIQASIRGERKTIAALANLRC